MITIKAYNIKRQIRDFFIRHKNAVSCAMLSTASLLGFVNPFLSSLIADNLVSRLSVRAVVAAAAGIVAVKGIRFKLRAQATKYIGSNARAPMVWLSRRIGKKLWWLEPMVGSWGWVGIFITRVMGGSPSSQTAMAITSALSDTLNTLVSGIVYYFTQSYVLSLLSALVFPSFTIVPWFARKTIRLNRVKRAG